eukprot:362306-Chlamydomonas_euryale.AAC.12
MVSLRLRERTSDALRLISRPPPSTSAWRRTPCPGDSAFPAAHDCSSSDSGAAVYIAGQQAPFRCVLSDLPDLEPATMKLATGRTSKHLSSSSTSWSLQPLMRRVSASS